MEYTQTKLCPLVLTTTRSYWCWSTVHLTCPCLLNLTRAPSNLSFSSTWIHICFIYRSNSHQQNGPTHTWMTTYYSLKLDVYNQASITADIRTPKICSELPMWDLSRDCVTKNDQLILTGKHSLTLTISLGRVFIIITLWKTNFVWIISNN